MPFTRHRPLAQWDALQHGGPDDRPRGTRRSRPDPDAPEAGRVGRHRLPKEAGQLPHRRRGARDLGVRHHRRVRGALGPRAPDQHGDGRRRGVGQGPGDRQRLRPEHPDVGGPGPQRAGDGTDRCRRDAPVLLSQRPGRGAGALQLHPRADRHSALGLQHPPDGQDGRRAGTIATLASRDTVVGVKDSSGAGELLAELNVLCDQAR